jgi:ABC-type branched-subunit amino acid transport system ATPase component
VQPVLEATNITKHFAGIAALSDVTVRVGSGELVALIGPNGAGKSTLFNCMSGNLRPDAGHVALLGERIDDLSPHRRARLGIARTFQQIELFSGLTVLEHLLITLRSHQRAGSLVRDLLRRSRPTDVELARCRAVISLVGLDGEADRVIESLSLGRARVVELARALAADPRILFLDEPSSGLDAVETNEMASVLEHVRRQSDVAVLLCEHDVAFVERLASRTVVLDCGRLIAEGETAAVLADPVVREAYLGTPA